MPIPFPSCPPRPELEALLKKAVAGYKAMTDGQRRAMHREQRRSYVIGEAGLGSDADEIALAAALKVGDMAELERLNRAAEERMRRAREYLDREGL